MANEKAQAAAAAASKVATRTITMKLITNTNNIMDFFVIVFQSFRKLVMQF